MTPPDEQPKSIEEETRDDVKTILEILNGNGKTGLCAKVNILWKSSLCIVGAIVVIFIKDFWI